MYDDPRLKEQHAVHSLSLLTHLVTITSLAVIVFLVLLIIRESYDTIAIWVPFIPLWVGHALSFILVVMIIAGFASSLIMPTGEPTLETIHIENEKIMPLLHYGIFSIVWYIVVASIILAFEILVFVYIDNGSVPFYSFLIPIYILSGFSILFGFLFRSSTVPIILTWVSILVFLALLQYENTYGTLSWIAVFSPVFFSLCLWTLVDISSWVHVISKAYELKVNQLEALIFYSLGFFTLMVAAVFFWAYADDSDLSSDNLLYALYPTLFGVLFLSIAVYKVISGNIALVIDRMGAERPRPLRQLASGSWDIDTKTSFQHHTLLGEVDVDLHSAMSSELLKFENSICFCNDFRSLYSHGNESGRSDTEDESSRDPRRDESRMLLHSNDNRS